MPVDVQVHSLRADANRRKQHCLPTRAQDAHPAFS
jgi:hypothetical protein